MARLSNICYVPEPQEQLENLGLKLIAQRKTYFTAWYIADGPDLSQMQEQAPLAGIKPQGREGGGQDPVSVNGGGAKRRIRYVLTHGVRWGAADLDSGRMWRQIMNCFPVDFPPKSIAHETGDQQRANLPPLEGLVAHRGVLEIAEEVYAGVRPWLGGIERGEVSAIRFGGHSLGGSVAVLLMLLAKARHGLRGGQVSAHLFGSPAVLARRSAVRKQGSKEEKIIPSSTTGIPLPLSENGATSLSTSPPVEDNHQHWSRTEGKNIPRLHPNTGILRESPQCPVLDVIGLPADAVRSLVLDKDMVPRMFLAADPSYGLLLKSPLVRGLLEWRERVWGPGVLTQDRFLFENVGLVHYIKTVGSEVLVRTLTSEQANEGLRLNMDDFVRQPMNVIKALFDHHRGHYSQDLEAAAAAAKYRSKMEKMHKFD